MKQNMIYLVLLSFFLSPFSFLLADTSITRDPAIGEIYYIGPTVTGEGIYHSTDFGETATCMDSTLYTNIDFMSICADLTPGVLYGYSMPENLYISYNYGQEDSWIFKQSDISRLLSSGVVEGCLYSDIFKHTEDYGNSLIYDQCQGFFGNLYSMEIDPQSNICYARIGTSSIPDSILLMISYDNFENLELQNVFNSSEYPIGNITRGFYSGELYAAGGDQGELRYSNDYGYSWEYKNSLYFNNITDGEIVGGRQPGEIYAFKTYTQLMGEIKHTYIYHSLDYGETFEIFHPFSHGTDPYYADFEAAPLEGFAPLTVQFTDTSSGDYLEGWEWDFQNDGVIDSYEQNPQYTYQDTGYYSVSLTIQYSPGEDTVARTNYIHVTGGSGISNEELPVADYKLSNFPNPFNPSTRITFDLPSEISKNTELEIYNLKGQRIRQFSIFNGQSSITWDGTNQNSQQVSSGIYLYKLNIENSPVNKMLLLK